MSDAKEELATFAAGCFWNVEEVFHHVAGVTRTRVGYTGGSVVQPSYKQVCGGDTGHAEAVQVTYNPEVITYEELLRVFWKAHDPTTENRQGPDIGDQYRSAVFYRSDEERAAAERVKAELEDAGMYDEPIVTEVSSFTDFYEAEEYHQHYLHKRGAHTCSFEVD